MNKFRQINSLNSISNLKFVKFIMTLRLKVRSIEFAMYAVLRITRKIVSRVRIKITKSLGSLRLRGSKTNTSR